MAKAKRTVFDKLNTLLFFKDTRVTTGEVYHEVRKHDFSSYYPKDDYIKSACMPTDNAFNIKDYGAVANDPKTDNSESINKAILGASKVGGTVVISDGDYSSSEIRLKSNITLFIDKNSSIIANETGNGYPNGAIIFAENENNITLTGGGKIKGNGHLFGKKPVYNENITKPSEYVDIIESRQDYRKQIRFAHESKYGSPIILKNCQNVYVNNFIIENSASWSFRLDNCNDVKIENFIINNNRNVANADGIDICGSSNVNIRHSFISTADDGIVIKNAVWLGNSKECSNIKIKDCEIISRTNSFKIGTETTFDIHDVSIENCKFLLPNLYPYTVSGIAVEAVDGSKVYNISAKNITINNCSCPIFIRLGNRNRASKVTTQSANAIEFGKKAKGGKSASKSTFNFKSEINNISIENIKAYDTEIPTIICGYKQTGVKKRVKNVTLKNIDIYNTKRPYTKDRRLYVPEYAKEYPEANRFRNLPSYSLFIRHAENIKTENFKCHQIKTWKKENYFKDVK